RTTGAFRMGSYAALNVGKRGRERNVVTGQSFTSTVPVVTVVRSVTKATLALFNLVNRACVNAVNCG
ncbi:MAG TPA: hypothetical protein VFG20_16470, partial [Planctomycetaceae bacterium]|nr:hypothetical protein [Planctomycetaceae bacterium]